MRPSRLEAAVLLTMVVLIATRLFFDPVIGMADNGDFQRVLRQSGLDHVPTEYTDKFFGYFNRTYRIVPRQPIDDPSRYYTYVTSTLLPIGVARWASVAVGRATLDIRAYATLHVAVLLAGVWFLLVASRPLRRSLRLVLAGALTLVLTDVGFIAYFNSFYSEGTALAFLVLGLGAGLLLRVRPAAWRGLLTVYFVAMAMVVVAKPSYVVHAPLLGLFGVYLAWGLPFRRAGRSTAAAMALALIALGAWYSRQTPRLHLPTSLYIGIFTDLLPHSPTPRQDLVELGLDPELVSYSGTNAYEAASMLYVPSRLAELEATVGLTSLARFYLRHPVRLYRFVDRCVRHAFVTRFPLGYFEKTSGRPPGAKPWGLWSAIRENAVPRSVWFLLAFFASGALALLLLRSPVEMVRALAVLYAVLVVVAGAELAISIFLGGGEQDLVRHLFLFNVAFDSCLILLLLGAAYGAQRSWHRRALARRAG